jgi:hypothetical protein
VTGLPAPLPRPSGPLPDSPPAGRCPACGSEELERLLEFTAPKHTSMLVQTRTEALAFPIGRISLRVCHGCGLITNTAFDAPGHDYSASYEETQAFSPRFRAYASELAQEMAAEYALEGAEVLEIGPGRGDFLLVLCDEANCSGHGVDPSWRFEHLEGPAAERIRMTRAFFDGSHVHPGCPLVVCRHTLEHVHAVSNFLDSLAGALEPGSPVLFEVPDTTRVMGEMAFWDIFYEHCSYFTPGSLARAFRRAGLAPYGLELAYDDQYILVRARADHDAANGARLPLEEPPAETVVAAQAFAGGLAHARRRWTELLREARGRGETTVIWGAGSKGVGFLAALGLGDEIAYGVDVNPAKHGMFMPGSGHEIVSPSDLVAIRPDRVLVMNPIYLEEIGQQLHELGLEPTLQAV